jgi:hypothetical protein
METMMETMPKVCEARYPVLRLVGPYTIPRHRALLALRREGGNPAEWPALLQSFWYLDLRWTRNRNYYAYRDWALDSGAFTAHRKGTSISLARYINLCKRLRHLDPTLTEIFALDVIGDWKTTLRNTEAMWKQGVEAIPTFHYGEPWDVLKGLCRDYPKVAIGGCAGRDRFAQQCFDRVWPARLHGLRLGTERSLLLVPWHSTDCSSWEVRPSRYQRWPCYGEASIALPCTPQNILLVVRHYLTQPGKEGTGPLGQGYARVACVRIGHLLRSTHHAKS